MALRFLNIILAALVFISSTGFVINKHYCQGELKETALVVKAKSCHEKELDDRANMPANCPMHQSKNSSGCEEKKGCCDNETEFVKLDIDQDIVSFEYQKLQIPQLATILVFATDFNLEETITSPVHFKNYKPPLIVCDVPVSLQTFLL